MNMVIGQRIVTVPSTKENVIFATNSDIKLESARKETEAEAVAVPLVADHHVEGASHLFGVEADHQFVVIEVETNHQFVVTEIEASHLLGEIEASHLFGEIEASHRFGEIEASHLLGEIEAGLHLQKGVEVDLHL